jgi:hypothetical protein
MFIKAAIQSVVGDTQGSFTERSRIAILTGELT